MDEQGALLGQKYLECFCRRSRDGFFVRYIDPALPDMYCHNFLELKKDVGPRLLRKTLEERIAAARAEGAVFFRLELETDPALLAGALPEGGEAEHNGRYALCPTRSDVEGWPWTPEWEIRPLGDPSGRELAQIDLALDEGRCGRDFCLRRAERKARVFTSGGSCRCYLACRDGMAAGACTLFEHGGGAELEDLVVMPALRHQKAASTLLRALTLRGLDDGCTRFFLTADEDDTPKAIYQALGFEKIGDCWAVTWRLQ